MHSTILLTLKTCYLRLGHTFTSPLLLTFPTPQIQTFIENVYVWLVGPRRPVSER